MDKDFIKFISVVLEKPIPEYMQKLIKEFDKVKGKRLVLGRKGWQWIKDGNS